MKPYFEKMAGFGSELKQVLGVNSKPERSKVQKKILKRSRQSKPRLRLKSKR